MPGAPARARSGSTRLPHAFGVARDGAGCGFCDAADFLRRASFFSRFVSSTIKVEIESASVREFSGRVREALRWPARAPTVSRG